MKSKVIYAILISFVLLTPFIFSDKLYNDVISAKQIWFYGSMGLLVLIFGIDHLLRKESSSIKFNKIDIPLLIFFSYITIRTVHTPFTPLLNNTRFLNYALLLILYLIVKCINSNQPTKDKIQNKIPNNVHPRGENIPISEIILSVLILMGLCQAIWGLMQIYNLTNSFNPEFKITGTFFNPAPYSLFLSTIFPLALGTFLRKIDTGMYNLSHPFSHKFSYYKVSYYIALITIISILIVLPATLNRASFLGLLAGSLVILYFKFNLYYAIRKILNSKIKILILFTVISVFLCMLIFILYYSKRGSSEGRLLIWEITSKKIYEMPMCGFGVGRFEPEFNINQAEYFISHPEEMDEFKGTLAGNTKYCFNEFLEMTYELGFIGLLLFIFVLVSLFISKKNQRLTALTFKENTDFPLNHSNFNSLIIYSSSIISILVTALVSIPFYSLPTLIIFFLLIAFFSSEIKNAKIFPNGKWLLFILRFCTYGILLTLIPISVFLFSKTKHQYEAYHTWKQASMFYQLGDYKGANVLFSEICNPLQFSGSFLQYYGKSLYLDGKYEKSISVLLKAKMYNSDDILYCSLGDSYKANSNFERAEACYLYASYMVPHKLYPLFLLATLYDETGQREKAVLIAKRVLDKDLKVKSIATEEIKEKMYSILKKSGY